MAATSPQAYSDPEYQAAHENVFSHPTIEELQPPLPPGISAGVFDEALKALISATEQNAVFTGQDLKYYVDPYEIPEATEARKIPSAAVCPSSVSQLQAVLEAANKYGIPVWTFSRGKNLGYGGPAPIVPGSLALDLHRMNKIIEVNEKLAYAVVEPGVTFGDLYNHCIAHKLKVWPSVPSLGWGSVIGNTLDRGMGFTPTAVHHEQMAGLEVVLANGDIVRTGQFAMSSPPSSSAHLTRLSFGPTIDGLFLQSNLGIVTKMGIALSPQPQAYMAVSFDMPNFGDIAPLIDVFGALRRAGVIPTSAWICNIIGQSTGVHKYAEWWDRKGPIPEWRVEEMKKEIGLGYWVAKFCLYGPRSIIEAQLGEVQKVVARDLPSGRLQHTLYEGSEGADGGPGLLDATTVAGPHGGMYVGVPSLFTLQFVDYMAPKDRGAHSAYSPILPLDGATILEWVTTARGVFESHGQDLVCDFYVHERCSVSVCMLFYDKMDVEQRTTTEKIIHGLFEEGAKRGFSKYRSHIAYMDMVAGLFDFNNHAYRRFVESLKDTLDPNGILSPGKMGIWPRRFREKAGTTLDGTTES